MTNRSLLLAFLAMPATWQSGRTEPAAPPAPAKYTVQIRYRIDAFRNNRLVQYNGMMQFLQSLGFEKDPGPEDEPENRSIHRMSGTIPLANARKILRERHVQAICLRPAGMKLPQDNTLVRVHLDLAFGLQRDRQQKLADQVRRVLASLGFQEGVGYDDRAHTRLEGAIPANRLEVLLQDLREQAEAREIPAPFALRWPLIVTEALSPEIPLPRPRPTPPPIPPGLEKITPDLRQLLDPGNAVSSRVRVEVILWRTPSANDRGWRQTLLRTAPGLILEGRLGALITARIPVQQLADLAALPIVSTVRLPRSAQIPDFSAPAPTAGNQSRSSAGGLEPMYIFSRRSQGIRVAIIDGDFRGWQSLVGKHLPANTHYLDLTAERQPDLKPDPVPQGAPGTLGHGTHCALAAARAAPTADLTLIRVDPAAPYQLQTIARAIQGEPISTLSLEGRLDELEARNHELATSREHLLEERKAIFHDFGQNEESKKRREAHRQQQAQLDREEQEHQEIMRRFIQLQQELLSLKGIKIVSSSLIWSEGHPVDGSSPLSRYFDDRPFRVALWFQAGGDTRGQAWTGLFRDSDDNGVMEFAGFSQPLAPDRWTPELNFLKWQSERDATTPDLPAGARVRISLQWREPHDPEFMRHGEDAYRQPLATVRLLVLRQLDPTGRQQPADDLEVIAQSPDLPQRLDNQPNVAAYEQTVEFTAAMPGRYVLRVEGRVPSGIRPAFAATLPALEKTWEMRPRIFVNTLAGAGRALLSDYVTDAGTIGMPGDAQRVITVGALDAKNQPRPDSACGAPWLMELCAKPNLLTWDVTALQSQGTTIHGSGLAAAVAAGLAINALNNGDSSKRLARDLRERSKPARWIPGEPLGKEK